MHMTLFAVTALGFLLGVRHATDVDHVVAITTIVCRERSARGAMRVGALWGIGHTATILLVGGAIVLFGLVVPPRVAVAMELAVALMLIALGLMNIIRAAARRRAHAHAHVRALGNVNAHVHPHAHPQDDLAEPSPPPVSLSLLATLRPLAIGVVHGLAGSAALALLVLTTIREARRALLYLAVFGGGTVLGMMLLTTAMTLPIALAARRFGSLERIMTGITGVISLGFGLFLIYQHGIAAPTLISAHGGGAR
jgi:high-affinity nickel-transport protein